MLFKGICPQLFVLEPYGKKSTLERSLIEEEALTSPMPPAGAILSKTELRDLIAYLITLR